MEHVRPTRGKRLRMALVCTEKLPVPPIRGGAIQIYISEIAPRLAERFDLTVYSIADSALPAASVGRGVRYRRFPAARYYPLVARDLARERYDIVHVFNRPAAIRDLKRASPASRFVLSLHNEMMHPEKITRQDGRQMLSATEAVVTVSRYISGTVLSRFPKARGKVRVLYSGAHPGRYRTVWDQQAQADRVAVRERYGLGDEPVILFVGRLTSKKGPDLLIRALPAVRRRHPQARLLIAGSRWFFDNRPDDYVRLLWQLAEPLGDAVRFTDFVQPHRMPEIYLAGDVLVAPNRWQEPLARVLYEAMAAGLPIITTPRGGNPEVVQDGVNGLVVPLLNDDTTNLVEAIDRLLSDPALRRRLGDAGRSAVEATFHFERVAEELTELWLELAQRAPAPAPPRPRAAATSPVSVRTAAKRRAAPPGRAGRPRGRRRPRRR